VPKEKSTFTFTDDLDEAVTIAKRAAWDKDVGVAGASVAQQCIGDGVRLFEHLGNESIKLEPLEAIDTPEATHLRYRLLQKR
jgi:hypothetical protein